MELAINDSPLFSRSGYNKATGSVRAIIYATSYIQFQETCRPISATPLLRTTPIAPLQIEHALSKQMQRTALSRRGSAGKCEAQI
jgi:hypothetical protein